MIGFPPFRIFACSAFGHPPGWNVQSVPDGVLLTPGDAPRDAMGNPLEALVMSGDDATGISSPDDPQVLADFRGQYEFDWEPLQYYW